MEEVLYNSTRSNGTPVKASEAILKVFPTTEDFLYLTVFRLWTRA